MDAPLEEARHPEAFLSGAAAEAGGPAMLSRDGDVGVHGRGGVGGEKSALVAKTGEGPGRCLERLSGGIEELVVPDL